MFGNGSFKYLYTFKEISKIYNIDSSTLRKKTLRGDFTENEVKKFGGTWLITQQAMIRHFGKRPLDKYYKTGEYVLFKPRSFVFTKNKDLLNDDDFGEML